MPLFGLPNYKKIYFMSQWCSTLWKNLVKVNSRGCKIILHEAPGFIDNEKMQNLPHLLLIMFNKLSLEYKKKITHSERHEIHSIIHSRARAAYEVLMVKAKV